MEAIDFSQFNRPKYFPEWLREGETLRLAEYDDGQLAELDANIRRMADQYDLDNASGEELDRIGKLLGEDRNGNDDDAYRVYLRLRTMLNTADGTVEDIIRFVKFFFSSEVVHLVPNYPAGIRILHDGYNDTMDFNRIIRQIVGAGIGYDTRELFNMTEEFPISDAGDRMRLSRNSRELFARNAAYRNGRVLRDGKTVLGMQYERLLRSGALWRDGTYRREGEGPVAAYGAIATPVLRNSGLRDLLWLGCTRSYADSWQAYVRRTGAVIRDGSECRNGRTDKSMLDALCIGDAGMSASETFPLSDRDGKAAVMDCMDDICHHYARDGSLLRAGTAYRSSSAVTDTHTASCAEAAAAEEWRSAMLRNGTAARDGVEKRFGFSQKQSVQDFMSFGIRRRYRRDGLYQRDGAVRRESGVLVAI